MIVTWFHEYANRLTLASVGIGVLVAFLYFKAFFQDASGFDEDVQEAAKSWWSFFGFNRVESEWSEMKILIWLLLSVGSGVIAYHQLPGWFPAFFQ